MPKYRVLVGDHIANGPDGKQRVYNQGDVVDSEVDLVERFNSKDPVASRKFERVFSDSSQATITSASVLDDMSLKQLQVLATEEEIDLRGATKKEDLVRIIRAARQ